jgi:nicotinate-nucleotide adenylyltransferase
MKLGIFGGSFDPPHAGHLWLCRSAQELYHLDSIAMVPNALSPLKDHKHTEAHHIVAMTRLTAFECESTYCDTTEICRDKVSYTIDTVKLFKDHYPEDDLYLLLGGDSLLDFYRWKDPNELVEIIGHEHILVAERSTAPLMAHKFRSLPMPYIQVSSTDIRNRIKNHLTIKGLVVDSVREYIIERKLYL